MIHTKPTLKKWGLHMTKKTPDIVIAHKKFGIMIIEVKAGFSGPSDDLVGWFFRTF